MEKTTGTCIINRDCRYGRNQCCYECGRRGRCRAACENGQAICGLYRREAGEAVAADCVAMRLSPALLEAARQRAGMKTGVAARRIGLRDAKALRRLETGERPARAELLYRMCVVYGCDFMDFFVRGEAEAMEG